VATRRTPALYGALIDACRRLIQHPRDRRTLLTETYRLCSEAGMLSCGVLEKFRVACEAHLYLELTGLEVDAPIAENSPKNVAALPKQRSRKIGR
jgi:hypothetical protein